MTRGSRKEIYITVFEKKSHLQSGFLKLSCEEGLTQEIVFLRNPYGTFGNSIKNM